MAEQAQRRAFEAQAQEKPTDNNHAFEELRHLIVAPEQEGIAAIQDRLENLEKRTQDVSSVVAEAIQMRREKGDDLALADALAPTIQETLRESVRRDPQVLPTHYFPSWALPFANRLAKLCVRCSNRSTRLSSTASPGKG